MFTMKEKIGTSQVGPGEVIRMGALFDLFQNCSGFQLDNCNITQEFYKTYNAVTLIMFRQVEIFKELKYGDEITIMTNPYLMKGTYGFRNTMIYDESGQVAVASQCAGATVNLETGKPVPIPKEILKIYPLGEKYEGMEYLPRKISIPKEESEESFNPVIVKKAYIDSYNHMNNARYIDVAGEYIPEDFKISRCRIAYKKPAKAGDLLIPKKYEDGKEKIIISLQDNHGEVYANVEYTGKR